MKRVVNWKTDGNTMGAPADADGGLPKKAGRISNSRKELDVKSTNLRLMAIALASGLKAALDVQHK